MAVTLAVAAAVACAGNPRPVPIHADTEGMEQLRGRWAGEYRSEETGRRGTIRFELTAAGDTARGEVVMMPGGGAARLEPVPADGSRDPVARGPDPEILGIHFVRCRGSHVQGTVDAYRDPETGHPLVTTFHGEVAGDSIGGSFSTYDQASGRRTGGVWHVRRRP